MGGGGYNRFSQLAFCAPRHHTGSRTISAVRQRSKRWRRKRRQRETRLLVPGIERQHGGQADDKDGDCGSSRCGFLHSRPRYNGLGAFDREFVDPALITLAGSFRFGLGVGSTLIRLPPIIPEARLHLPHGRLSSFNQPRPYTTLYLYTYTSLYNILLSSLANTMPDICLQIPPSPLSLVSKNTL